MTKAANQESSSLEIVVGVIVALLHVQSIRIESCDQEPLDVPLFNAALQQAGQVLLCLLS